MKNATTTERRDWNWDTDGTLEGQYVETRQVTIKNGPSAGQTKPVLDFHVGLEDELVSVWPPTVLTRMLRMELERRSKPDFEPGEQMWIRPKGKADGPNGPYWDFHDVEFEHAAPKPTAADVLAAVDVRVSRAGEERPAFSDDEHAF